MQRLSVTNLSLENNLQFRCYEAKLEESEKAGSQQESNPGHLWLEPPVLYMPLSYNSQTTTSPYNPLLNDSVAHLAATQYMPSELC